MGYIDLIEENPIEFVTLYMTALLIFLIIVYLLVKAKKKYLSKLHNQVYEEIKRFEPSQKYVDEIG